MASGGGGGGGGGVGGGGSSAGMAVVVTLAQAAGSAAAACGVALVVGMALLEIPFSLPFAVILGLVLLLLGALVLYRTRVDQAARATAITRTSVTVGAACTRLAEVALLAFVAILAALGGIFSIVIFFQSRLLAPPVRLGMYVLFNLYQAGASLAMS